MTRRYPVVFEWAGKNFSGFSPDVPGCVATGKTLEKVRKEMTDALQAHLQWMKKDGDPIPEPSNSTTIDLQEDPEFPNPPGYYVVVQWLEIKVAQTKSKRVASRKSHVRELAAA